MTARIFVCGMPVDLLDLHQAVDRVLELSQSDRFTYVVTPNAAHFVKVNEQYDALGPIYTGADLVLNDSRVVARFTQITRGQRLPVAPGSELTPLVLRRLDAHGARVSVIGMHERDLPVLARHYPRLEFRHHDPPHGFIRDPNAVAACLEFLAAEPTPVTFFAVGNPQQERLARLMREQPGARGVGLCIGASLEFIVGRQTRAPKVLQRVGLEWAFRLAQEPKRMGRRYLVESPRFFYYALKYGDAPRGP